MPNVTSEKKIQPWLEVGYELFTTYGLEGLKVEKMANIIGKSRSSFYHHFADIEIFTEMLLQVHTERSALIAEREQACETLVPDLIEVLVAFKKDLLFSRQLRVHRHIKAFRRCFESVNEKVGGAFFEVWAHDLGLSEEKQIAEGLLDLIMDNFYLQITEENLNAAWLTEYVNGIKSFASQIQHPGVRQE